MSRQRVLDYAKGIPTINPNCRSRTKRTWGPPGTCNYNIRMFVLPPFNKIRKEDGLVSVYECDLTTLEFAKAVDCQDPRDVDRMFEHKQLGIHEGSSLFQYCEESFLFRKDVYNESAKRAEKSMYQGDELDAQFYFMITRYKQLYPPQTIKAQSSIRNMQTFPEGFDIVSAWYFFN